MVLTVEQLIAEVLSRIVGLTEHATASRKLDWGIPLLAFLYASDTSTEVSEDDRGSAARAAAIGWARHCVRVDHGPGLFTGGFASTATGLAYAATVEPRMGNLARLAAESITNWSATTTYRDSGVAFADYDLLYGPSGLVLALTNLPAVASRSWEPLVRHLIRLVDSDELPRLRVYNRGATDLWMAGRINLGLGHGLPGVLAALIAAKRRSDRADMPDRRLSEAIGRTAAYLVRQSRRDERGLVCWPFATTMPGETGAVDDGDVYTRSSIMERRRQAWCYGTPGIAWQLTEAGDVLGDHGLRNFGLAAMASLCENWDDSYLDTIGLSGRLAICHGAAGLLAIADAFALHAGLELANQLAERLRAIILAELSELASLGEEDLSLLTGVTGVLAVLHTGRNLHLRGWMHTLGLR